MKAKDKKEKEHIKLKFAVALTQLLDKSEYKSLREFASGAGLEPAHIQRLAAGKVDAALSTLISLSEGLSISFTLLAKYYENVSEKDIKDYLEKKEKLKRLRGNNKSINTSVNKLKKK